MLQINLRNGLNNYLLVILKGLLTISIHLKLEHIVVYENSSDEFDIGHCPIKVKVRV